MTTQGKDVLIISYTEIPTLVVYFLQIIYVYYGFTAQQVTFRIIVTSEGCNCLVFSCIMSEMAQ
jgi:hypothetical protein